MKHNAVLINPEDNVAVALEDIACGSKVKDSAGMEIAAVEDIPYSHKVAVKDIRAGSPIIKYGEEIGFAARDIARGGWVHTHNLEIREDS